MAAKDDAGAVVAGVLVEAGGDRAPLLEPAKVALDDVAASVGLRCRTPAVVHPRDPAGPAVRDLVPARWGMTTRMPLPRSARRVEGCEYALSATTTVGRDRGRPPVGTAMSASTGISRGCPRLARGEPYRQWSSDRIHSSVGLGRPTASGAPQGVIGRLRPRNRVVRCAPPKARGAPAACWWARAIVESTDTTHSGSPAACAWPCSSTRTVSSVPSLAHRSNRHHTVCHAGRSAAGPATANPCACAR